MGIVVRGLEPLLEVMAGIESRVRKKKIFAGAMRKALEPVRQRVFDTVPDDPLTTDNRLEANLRKAVLDQTSMGVLGRVGETPKGFVGYFHERGTSQNLAARPFLQPAVDATTSQFMEILGEDIMLGVLGAAVEEGFDG